MTRPREILNKVLRVVLLASVSLVLLIYLCGCVANIFGLMDLRPPNAKIVAQFKPIIQSDDIIQFYDAPGIRIAYIRMPAMTKDIRTAVFYIHGSPGSLDANTKYLLDGDLRMNAIQYTYDRIGYGGSRPLEAAKDISEQASHLAALIRNAGADKHVLVGHSLGCSIAACLSVNYPELVDGLVLVAPPLDPALEPSSWWRPVLNFPVIRFGIPGAMRVSNDELMHLRQELADYKSQWHLVNCPVTVIQGDQDMLVPFENVEFIRMHFQHAALRTVILENEGHFIYWTHEELIAEEIIRMLSTI